MVTGGTDGAERRFVTTVQNPVHRFDRRPGRPQRRTEAVFAHGRIGIEPDPLAVVRRRGENSGNVVRVMHPAELFACCFRRFTLIEVPDQATAVKMVDESAEPLRAFRMPGAGVVPQTIGMRDQYCRHFSTCLKLDSGAKILSHSLRVS